MLPSSGAELRVMTSSRGNGSRAWQEQDAKRVGCRRAHKAAKGGEENPFMRPLSSLRTRSRFAHFSADSPRTSFSHSHARCAALANAGHDYPNHKTLSQELPFASAPIIIFTAPVRCSNHEVMAHHYKGGNPTSPGFHVFEVISWL